MSFVLAKISITFLNFSNETLLEKDGQPDAQYHVTPSGWTIDELFLVWLTNIVKYATTTVDEPILIVLYNHCSQATPNYCRENNITLLSLSPDSSHRMQPLHLTFLGPLTKTYNSELDIYLKFYYLSQITVYEEASLFDKAFCFKTTGIFFGTSTSVNEISESSTVKDLSERHRTPLPSAERCSFWSNEDFARR